MISKQRDNAQESALKRTPKGATPQQKKRHAAVNAPFTAATLGMRKTKQLIAFSNANPETSHIHDFKLTTFRSRII